MPVLGCKGSGTLSTKIWSAQMIMRMFSTLITSAFSLLKIAVGYGMGACKQRGAQTKCAACLAATLEHAQPLCLRRYDLEYARQQAMRQRFAGRKDEQVDTPVGPEYAGLDMVY